MSRPVDVHGSTWFILFILLVSILMGSLGGFVSNSCGGQRLCPCPEETKP